MSSCQRWSNREFRKMRFSLPGQTSNHLTERRVLGRHLTHSGPPPYQKTCSARRHATHQATGHSAPPLSSSCLSPQHGLSCIERTKEARQDVRCSMDAPAREYRPARFPLVDIAHYISDGSCENNKPGRCLWPCRSKKCNPMDETEEKRLRYVSDRETELAYKPLQQKSSDMPPNMPHSLMTPTPPLRPIHPWPGVARGLGPRVKGRVLPNSPKSAPLTGGRFR